MRLTIITLILMLCLPLKPKTQSTGKIVRDKVDVHNVYTVYNGDLMGGDCNVAMFVEACLERGYNPNHLSRVIEYESMYKTSAVNQRSGASGLIQFMPSTARGLGTSIHRIRTMNFEQQLRVTMYYLDLAERDYGFINDSIDMYLAVFYPMGITYRDRNKRVICREGSNAYNQNRVNDRDKDGDIDVVDIGRLMKYDAAKIDTTVVLDQIRIVPRMSNMVF